MCVSKSQRSLTPHQFAQSIIKLVSVIVRGSWLFSCLRRELGLLRQRSQSSDGSKKPLLSSKCHYLFWWSAHRVQGLDPFVIKLYNTVALATNKQRGLSFRSNIFIPHCDWFWVNLLERQKQPQPGNKWVSLFCDVTCGPFLSFPPITSVPPLLPAVQLSFLLLWWTRPRGTSSLSFIRTCNPKSTRFCPSSAPSWPGSHRWMGMNTSRDRR